MVVYVSITLKVEVIFNMPFSYTSEEKRKGVLSKVLPKEEKKHLTENKVYLLGLFKIFDSVSLLSTHKSQDSGSSSTRDST